MDRRHNPGRRRGLTSAAAFAMLLATLRWTGAWAGGPPAALDQWARSLLELNRRLAAGRVDVTGWQDEVAVLNRSVPVPEIVGYLDIDRLVDRFHYSSFLADYADPLLPSHVTGARGPWFLRVFGMRRGGAIIPHVHNHMVSAHLVVSGSFRARTHDRVSDEAGAVLLRPSLDSSIVRGDVITMSDRRDNQHWLVALEDRSVTFDVGVVDLPASWRYGHAANRSNMIFVDAGRKPESDGLVVAPVMSFEACAAKYATG